MRWLHRSARCDCDSPARRATEARKAERAPIRGPRCRAREPDEGAVLAALNAAIAIPLPPTISISAGDPGAEAAAANVSWASFGLLKATAADIERTWITGARSCRRSRGCCFRWLSWSGNAEGGEGQRNQPPTSGTHALAISRSPVVPPRSMPRYPYRPTRSPT